MKLLVASCLLVAGSYTAHAQAVTPLRPLVVTLDSGTFVRRPLIGIEPAAYQQLRAGEQNDAALLLVRAGRIRTLEQLHRQDSLANVATTNELRSARLDVAALHGQLTQQELITQRALALPVEKPFLLNKNTYRGAALGAAVLVALKFFVFRP